ncbi:tetratricopeptide repeat-containing glycosyltransferase [Paenibacillus sp. 22594]|uniref:tetratricopeptide repeat-containing glycosyltransferase n=1 Tax=Paenibacillus sp. 22594 TaxID=3453947 RepID=UPI003F848B5A
MIIKNEEKYLSELLLSIKPYVDEIIIVDNNSTDDSYNIAMEAGAQVVRASATSLDVLRNIGLELATAEWVLVIDADECIHTQDLIRIREIVKKTDADAISFPNYNYYGDGLWAFVYKLRLFRNDPQIRWSGKWHESVQPSIDKSNKTMVRMTDITLHHLEVRGRDRSLEKRHRNIERIQEALNTDPNSNLYSLLSLEFFVIDNFEKALECCQKAFDLEENYYLALRFMAQYYIIQGELDEAEKLLTKALQNKNNSRDRLYFALASIYQIRGSYDIALNYIDEALKIDSGAHHFINKAFLVMEMGGDQTEVNNLLKLALIKNPLLLEKSIYASLQKANIYAPQTSLLPIYQKFNDKPSFWNKIQGMKNENLKESL